MTLKHTRGGGSRKKFGESNLPPMSQNGVYLRDLIKKVTIGYIS